MRVRLFLAIALASVALALAAAPAQASFGLRPGAEGFDASLTQLDGSPAVRAGSHPYELHVHVGLNRTGAFADGDLRDLHLALPPSLFANPAAVAECNQALFHTPRVSPYQASLSGESCPDASQVGVVAIHSSYAGGSTRYFGVFNLTPPFGAAEAVGFAPFGTPIVLAGHFSESDALSLDLRGLPQRLSIYGVDLTLWGTPAASPDGASWDFSHDGERGNCLNELDPASPFGQEAAIEPPYTAGTCSTGGNPKEAVPRSYLSLPTACDGPLRFAVSVRSWQQPAAVEGKAISHDAQGHPLGLGGCVEPLSRAKVQLQTESAAAATGLVFNIDVNDGGGLLNPGGTVRSQIQKAVVALPEGLTINPSLGAGLGVCTRAELARETVDSAPGAGCPNVSKIGDVAIEGLIGLPETVRGSVFLAKPYENPFDTLLALYLVASSPRRGLFAEAVGRVEPDPRSGQLVASFEHLPQLHYSHLALSLREGQRAALISPPACGSFTARLELTPWSDPGLVVPDSSSFPISHGAAGGACPAGGLAPFHPALQAGSLNPQAGAYTPFYLHIARGDGEQEITSYSATFPPGLLGKLAGVPFCPDAAIEAAKGRDSGAEEASPSCPERSRIGHTLAGYGVGGTLAYASGALYLAGPYHGAPLSVAAITAARVGPFDLGTVVVRSAIRIDPRSARASIDAAGSDPIPHIRRGIPLHLRDIRAYVDRPGFTLNPTGCDPTQILSTVTGAGADLFAAGDDATATAAQRFQVFGCSALGFKPALALRLRGATRQGRFPSLRAAYVPRPGDANVASASVALPPSLFLAQEHIDAVCTRAQFAARACPPGSIYGHARAITPLLEEPLEGPVYLRSSSNPVPDLVASLRGRGISIEVEGRIDSSHGGLRGNFEGLPDAPVTSFTLTLDGGRHGLLVNAESLCAAPQRATARFTAQNNETEAQRPRLRARCAKHGGRRRGHGSRGGKR